MCSNLVNFNAADIDSCGCLSDLEAKIGGNGEDSDSEIKFEAESKLDLDQDNDSDLDNDADADGDTGDNDANDNVGGVTNDPSVDTGDTETKVKVNNEGNANTFGEDLSDLLNDTEFEFDFSFSGFLKLIASAV